MAGKNKLFVVRTKPNQVELRGVNLNWATRAQWRKAIDAYAKELQKSIANQFAGERVAGRRLLRNSPEWNREKRRRGLDPRRGHATNRLQEALLKARLFNVAFSTGGRVFITFIESRLVSRVPHAEFYAEKKTQGGAILQVSQRQVMVEAKEIQAWAHKQRDLFAAKVAQTGGAAIAGRRMSKARRQAAMTPKLKKALEDLTAHEQKLARLEELRKRAPLNPAFSGRENRIREGGFLRSGMIQRTRNQAIKQLAGGNAAKAKQISRMIDTALRNTQGDGEAIIREMKRLQRRLQKSTGR